MINVVFCGVFGTLLLLTLFWGFKVLPTERWQMIAAVPLVKNSRGSWRALNLTYYGFFSATGSVVGVAMMLLLMASVGIPLPLAAGFIGVMLAMCIPASKVIAAVVEHKRNTFTIAGAAFLAALVGPPLAWVFQQLLRSRWQLEIHLLPVLAAAGIAYAIGESIGRLACLSFGCCYGKPVREASPRLAALFRSYNLVLQGDTKKAAYASGLAGEPLIPVQVLTSLVFALAGLAGLALFLAQMWRAAALVPVIGAWGWRAISELLRADYRGAGRISSYQVMSWISLAYLAVVISILPSQGAAPNLGVAFSRMLSLPVVGSLQALWVGLFLYYGRSTVTASTVSFYVLADQV